MKTYEYMCRDIKIQKGPSPIAQKAVHTYKGECSLCDLEKALKEVERLNGVIKAQGFLDLKRKVK